MAKRYRHPLGPSMLHGRSPKSRRIGCCLRLARVAIAKLPDLHARRRYPQIEPATIRQTLRQVLRYPGARMGAWQGRRSPGPGRGGEIVGATYVCRSPRADAPDTREAVEKFYRRGLKLSGKHSRHLWRSVLSTWANDAGEDADAVEAQLDHATGGKVKAAYDRAKRSQRRANLMAWHEEALVAARDGAKVASLTKHKAAS